MDNTKLKSRLATKAQALQKAPAEREPASLVPVESGYAALNGNTLDLIRENLKEQPLTYQMFDVVKSPSGGSTVFTVPGLAGDEAEKELTPLGPTGIPPTRWRARRLPVSATIALSQRTARPAPTVLSTTTAPRTGRPGPRPVRNRCCCSCCGRATCCPCWFGFQ